MTVEYIYTILDEFNNIVIKGTNSECCGFLNIKPPTLTGCYIRDGKLLDKYDILRQVFHIEAYKDGELVAKGTKFQVSSALGIRHDTISKASRSGKMAHGYKFVRVLDDMKPRQVKKSKKEQEFDSIYEHLKIYGNTISVREPTEVMEWLKEKGLDTNQRYVKPLSYIGDMKGKSKGFWVLEAI